MKRAWIAALGLALTAACASAPNLPPKAGPEEVKTYDPNIGQVPPEGYKTIGPVRVELPLGTSASDIMTALRTEAAKLGADAIIFRGIRNTTEGQMATNMNREEKLIGEATAIYWPQPEGETESP